MRVFYLLTIAEGVLQLVDDGRDSGEVATRVGGSDDERDEVERETACRQRVPSLSKRLSFVPSSLFDQSISSRPPCLFLSSHGLGLHGPLEKIDYLAPTENGSAGVSAVTAFM